MFTNRSSPSDDAIERLKSNYEKLCAEAGNAISDSEVLLFVTGAGFSADSGLAVYEDVANIPAYQERGLKYHDICDPIWKEREPELFYGFWGQCFNDYRSTQPHEGYEIVAKWRDSKNKGQVADEIRSLLMLEDSDPSLKCEDRHKPYPVLGHAGAFFVFTSNVDAHSFDVFQAHEVHECHGNIELWQCETRNCTAGMWRAPLDFRFLVDQKTMCAPEKRDSIEVSTNAPEADESERPPINGKITARVGHILGSTRQKTLQYMPRYEDGCETNDNDDWNKETNWPKCGACSDLARPAILMFGDCDIIEDISQENRWRNWIDSVLGICVQRDRSNPLRVCVVEVGCGMNVPTCRVESETFLNRAKDRGAKCNLIRINPDFPLSDRQMLAEDTISIMNFGLDSLKQIDQFVLLES